MIRYKTAELLGKGLAAAHWRQKASDVIHEHGGALYVESGGVTTAYHCEWKGVPVEVPKGAGRPKKAPSE